MTAIGGGVIVMLSCLVIETGPGCPPDVSVSLNVTLVVPAAVGVPEITPALLKVKPAGSVEPLARLQVRAPAPPLACKVTL